MEIKINKEKFYLKLEEWKQQQLWYHFKERVAFATGFSTNKDLIKQAEDYFINKYPEYTVFKDKN